MTRLSDIVDNAKTDDVVQYTTENGGIGWVRPLSYKIACSMVNKIAADLFMKAMGRRNKKFYEILNDEYRKKIRK